MLGPWQPLPGAKGWDCTDAVASGALAEPAPGLALGREIPYEGARSASCFYQCTKPNWTEASWKLKSRRFLRGELPLTQFCRTWLKIRNSCRKLVVSPGLAELVTWQGCVSIPGSESGQRSLTPQDHLHFEGMLCLGQVCRTQHSSTSRSPVKIPLLEAQLSREAVAEM